MKNKLKLLTLLTLLATTAAYDNKTAWKTDEAGNLVLKDGNPVYTDASGREMIIDQGTIAKLNGEAKGHREAKETAEAKLKVFDGLDPEIARKAIETVGKLDAKKLIDAGEVDKVRKEISDQFTAKLGEKDAANTTLQQRLDNMMVDGLFNGSSFVRENIAVPSDMFQSYFRSNFKVEDGKVVAYGKDGNRLLSKTKAGEYAEPDEALQLLVEMHPQKDVIMKANVGSGSGSGGNGGNSGKGRTMKRSEFDKLNPAQKMETSTKVGKGEMVLTD